MQWKIIRYVDSCRDCKAFLTRKHTNPSIFHKVPSKNWEVVAVDLYGPMLSNNHVVVVQDIGSRFCAAKLVTSTKSTKFIPALEEIYNAYGNLEIQISDNGPPFNPKAMRISLKTKYWNEKNSTTPSIIQPSETLMCSLSKRMKIAHLHYQPEKKALERFLQNYIDTPHPGTDV